MSQEYTKTEKINTIYTDIMALRSELDNYLGDVGDAKDSSKASRDAEVLNKRFAKLLLDCESIALTKENLQDITEEIIQDYLLTSQNLDFNKGKPEEKQPTLDAISNLKLIINTIKRIDKQFDEVEEELEKLKSRETQEKLEKLAVAILTIIQRSQDLENALNESLPDIKTARMFYSQILKTCEQNGMKPKLGSLYIPPEVAKSQRNYYSSLGLNDSAAKLEFKKFEEEIAKVNKILSQFNKLCPKEPSTSPFFSGSPIPTRLKASERQKLFDLKDKKQTTRENRGISFEKENLRVDNTQLNSDSVKEAEEEDSEEEFRYS